MLVQREELRHCPGGGEGGGWGGVLPYISYIGMSRPKGYGFEPFWFEMGIDFDHYDLKSGMVSREPQERINIFVFSIPNK